MDFFHIWVMLLHLFKFNYNWSHVNIHAYIYGNICNEHMWVECVIIVVCFMYFIFRLVVPQSKKTRKLLHWYLSLQWKCETWTSQMMPVKFLHLYHQNWRKGLFHTMRGGKLFVLNGNWPVTLIVRCVRANKYEDKLLKYNIFVIHNKWNFLMLYLTFSVLHLNLVYLKTVLHISYWWRQNLFVFFFVIYLMMLSISCLSKESVQVWGFVNVFVTSLFFTVRSC
jgi:hypothetical protein